MAESQPFKQYYGVQLMENLAERVASIHPAFPRDQAIAHVAAEVEGLELKGRVALIAAALRAGLPQSYPEALDILLQILGPEIPAESGMFDAGWWLMPIAYFVEAYGLAESELSLDAIYAITKRHTGEFAIRPYLEQDPEATLARLHVWAADPNAHVRRLVSEGTRTRLPWARRLELFVRDPEPVLALLEKLKDDPSAYVRKSVANNLNDITKDHSERVLNTLAQWQAEGGAQRQWIVRHALRTLVKAGDPRALALLGYGTQDAAAVTVDLFVVEPPTVRTGESVLLRLTLHNAAEVDLAVMVDYRMGFPSTSARGSTKVFKWTALTLAPHARLTLEKRHVLRPVTTRPLRQGVHRVGVQVNGKIQAQAEFTLED
jgi:3-methyladenine DNA glycosylase AlkC